PTFCLCAYLCARSLAGDGRRWTIAAVCACIFAPAVRSQLVCIGSAFAVAAAVLWLVGPRCKELRRGWSRSDTAGAALLCLGALIALNALISDHSNEWAVVTQNYQGRMWRLVLEACSALLVRLRNLAPVGGVASP